MMFYEQMHFVYRRVCKTQRTNAMHSQSANNDDSAWWRLTRLKNIPLHLLSVVETMKERERERTIAKQSARKRYFLMFFFSSDETRGSAIKTLCRDWLQFVRNVNSHNVHITKQYYNVLYRLYMTTYFVELWKYCVNI